MDRRSFIRLAVAGSATGIIAPKLVLANTASMSGGVFYTKDAPGRWSKKVGGHLPNIEVAKSGKDVTIQVVTSHEMKDFDHYIVKHIVLDKDFNFLEEKMFDPKQDRAPVSQFTLGNYRGPVNVLSVCNKHDTWLNIAEV